MNSWVKTLLALAAFLFGAIGLLALARGEWKGALSALVFLGFVGFIGGAGWFHFRFPLPPLPSDQRYGVLSELKRFRTHYPGWPSKLAAAVIIALVLLFVTGQVLHWRTKV